MQNLWLSIWRYFASELVASVKYCPYDWALLRKYFWHPKFTLENLAMAAWMRSSRTRFGKVWTVDVSSQLNDLQSEDARDTQGLLEHTVYILKPCSTSKPKMTGYDSMRFSFWGQTLSAVERALSELGEAAEGWVILGHARLSCAWNYNASLSTSLTATPVRFFQCP